MISVGPAVVDVRPAVVNLRLYAGDDVHLELINEYDLSDAVILAQIRTTPDTSTVLAEFDITVDGAHAWLSMPGDTVATLPAGAVWDLQVTWADGTVETLARGTVTTMAEVSR